jgi:thiol-disulfide isomerase/thioredoxin
VYALAVAAFSVAGTAWAQEAAGPAPEDAGGAVEAKAADLLQKTQQFYSGLERFRFDAESTLTMGSGEAAQTMESSADVAVDRAGYFAAEVQQGEAGDVRVVSDAEQITLYSPTENQYMQNTAPDSLAEVLAGGIPMATSWPLFVALIGGEGGPSMDEVATSGSYAGEEDFAGTKVHRVTLSDGQVEMDVLIATGEQPWIRAIYPDAASLAAQPGTPAEIDLELLYSNWEVVESFPEGFFALDLPEDAVDVMAAAQDEGPQGMVGEPAPAFELPLLDGGRVSLAEHAGSDVVVLDFWATWCGPCRKGLPVLHEVTRDYAGQGVAFYAVNLRETPEQIRAFLEEMEIDPPVALDEDGSVGQAYGATSIPTTIIIGKDGTVQAVHVGIPADTSQLADQLRNELDTLLAGNQLARAMTP